MPCYFKHFQRAFCCSFYSVRKFFQRFYRKRLNEIENSVETAKNALNASSDGFGPDLKTCQVIQNVLTVYPSTSTNFFHRVTWRLPFCAEANYQYSFSLGSCKSCFYKLMPHYITLQIITGNRKKSWVLLSPSICRTSFFPNSLVLESLDHTNFNYYNFLIRISDGLILMRKHTRHICISLKPLIEWTTIFSCQNCGVLRLSGSSKR